MNNTVIVNNMTYSKLQKPWYSEDKFIINSMIILKWNKNKKHDRFKHFILC